MPSDIYSRSPRAYPEKVDEWAYPDAMHVRLVTGNGYVSWHDTPVFVGEGLRAFRPWVAFKAIRPEALHGPGRKIQPPDAEVAEDEIDASGV